MFWLFPSAGTAVTGLLMLTTLAPRMIAAESDSFANSADAPIQLDAFPVKERRTESDSYRVEETISATKTNTPLLNVPQSISIVSEEQIKDQQMRSLSDVVRYVPGISSHQGENNRDQVVFRGNSSSADFFLNGVRDDVQYYRDLYNLDRVEVLLGPDAMIFGRGGGGGLINRVLKEAGFTSLREVTLEAGAFAQRRVAVDLNEAASATVAVRLNAMAESSDSFRNFVSLHRSAVNPTLTLAPSAQTKVTVSCEHFHDQRTADRGITSVLGRPADVPIGTYFGNPADSHVRADVDFLTASFEHQAGNLTIRNRALFGDYDRGYQNYVPGAVNSAQTLVALTAYNNATRRQNLFDQTDLVYTATTGGMRHTLLGGVELGTQRTDNFRNTGYFNNTDTTLQVPFASPTTLVPVTFRQSATDADNHLRTDLAAIYAQDQVEFSPRLQAIAGLRFDSFDLTYHNNRNGDTLGRTDRLVSPRAGLVFKPVPQASLYASYSVSYLPSSGDQFSSLTTVTQQVQPEKFTNHELGLKWALPAGAEASVAAYQLDRTHTRSTDPTDPTRIVQTGSTRANGLELGLSGRVTPAWSLAGGYAYQDASIRSATTAAPAGAQVPLVPHHQLSLWNRYQLLPSFGLGLGVVYRTSVFAAIDNTVALPGYASADAGVFWTLTPAWHLQANVENITNRRYIVNADSNTNLSPGSPRAVRVMLRARF